MNIEPRKLQRLKNYDYSQSGLYFITCCTQNRLKLFGAVQNDHLLLNAAGHMVLEKFTEASFFYPEISVDKLILMPNHLHAIVEVQQDRAVSISKPDNIVSGMDCLNMKGDSETNPGVEGVIIGAPQKDSPATGTTQRSFPTTRTTTVSEYIQRFKTLTTKLYIDGVRNDNYLPFHKKLWQKSFHDRIIRNKDEYYAIWKYIDTNPQKWKDDVYYIES